MRGKDNIEVAADPIVDLSDTNFIPLLLEGVVDRLYGGRERWGSLHILGEMKSYSGITDALNSASKGLLRPRSGQKSIGGSIQVGRGNNLEKCVSRSPRELLGGMLKACNGVLDSSSGESRGCLFWLPQVLC